MRLLKHSGKTARNSTADGTAEGAVRKCQKSARAPVFRKFKTRRLIQNDPCVLIISDRGLDRYCIADITGKGQANMMSFSSEIRMAILAFSAAAGRGLAS